MIHSPGSMPTGNFDEPAVSSTQQPDSPRSFRLPADYYSAPLSEVKPFFPAWVPWGCGSAAALVLVLMFAGGALVSGPRLAALFDLTIGMTIGEVKNMYTPEVSGEQRETFDDAVSAMREGLREGSVKMEKVQPFLQALQKAMGDDKVTPEELERLTKIATDAVESTNGLQTRFSLPAARRSA